MADFNSRYTGAEIEAAIARTENIRQNVQVWAGAPTNGDIALSSLPVNPDTGDRTGIYNVVLSRTSAAVGNPSEPSYISMVGVFDEGGYSVGTAHARFTGTQSKAHEAVMYVGNFSGHEYIYDHSDDSFQNNPLYIHKIFREQSGS